MSHYDVLGIGPDASHADVRRAWLAQARRHHPDRGGDPDAMRAVNEAWAVLGDPHRRRAYDRELRPPPAAAPAWTPPAPPPFEEPLPLYRPRSPLVAMVPIGLFAAAVAAGCLGLVLDEPAVLAVAAATFAVSCASVIAATLLSMRHR